MKNYLAVFLGSKAAMDAWMAQPEDVRKPKDLEGMKAWMKWTEDHKASIVSMGGPLGKTKAVGKSGITDTRNEMGAFTVVMAASHEEAAKMFENHPHFMIFPGDRVEVMEVMPIPSMK
jgi:hypothetical protein